MIMKNKKNWAKIKFGMNTIPHRSSLSFKLENYNSYKYISLLELYRYYTEKIICICIQIEKNLVGGGEKFDSFINKNI